MEYNAYKSAGTSLPDPPKNANHSPKGQVARLKQRRNRRRGRILHRQESSRELPGIVFGRTPSGITIAGHGGGQWRIGSITYTWHGTLEVPNVDNQDLP